MWDAGLGAKDPELHVGQLTEALLRDVRYSLRHWTCTRADDCGAIGEDVSANPRSPTPAMPASRPLAARSIPLI